MFGRPPTERAESLLLKEYREDSFPWFCFTKLSHLKSVGNNMPAVNGVASDPKRGRKRNSTPV